MAVRRPLEAFLLALEREEELEETVMYPNIHIDTQKIYKRHLDPEVSS